MSKIEESLRLGKSVYSQNLWLRLSPLRNWKLAEVLFILALVVYLLTRIIGLADFPIYFFTDEAAQTILAQDFLRDNFKNYAEEFLPTFFENGGKYNLGFSVYVQIIPLLLFGRSVFVTRFVSVIFAVLAAIAIGVSLRNVFKIRHWWVGVFVLSMTPTWFLHSRTAFETALAVSLYALFIFFYFLYRFNNRLFLLPALLCGALAFYSYSSMQPVMLISGILLLILDSPYHFKGRWILLVGVAELIILSLPYIRFLFTHPEESYHQLEMLGSYWASPLSLMEKSQRFIAEYLSGLNPLYWYSSNPHELSRHVMLGYGHFLWVFLPFLIMGLLYSLLHLKDPLYRILLAILIAAPVGAAIVQLGITRILVMVIPAALFTAIGLSISMDWLSRFRVKSSIIPLAVFLMCFVGNFLILLDALHNGPLWYRDYSLDGMQYGARQIFPAVTKYLHENPEKEIILSPSWANGTDVIARFMLSDPIPIELGSIDGYFDEYRKITPDTVFVMIPEEYSRVIASNKFTNIKIIKIIDYPDGTPGFYFVSLQYVPEITQILENEKEKRRELLKEQIMVNDIQTEIQYSRLDMGNIEMAFDGDEGSVIRTLEANPLVISLNFGAVLTIHRIVLRIGGTTTQTKLDIGKSNGNHIILEKTEPEALHPRNVIFVLEKPTPVRSIRIQIKSVYDPEPAHVHLWEVTLQ